MREIANELGLINARKHDSQDICFVPDGDYAKFIEQYTGRTYPNGNFVDTKGHILGEHKGIIRYTVGQRKGLGLALPHPMYVKEKNLDTNEVILCDNNELFSKELYATDINLITCDKSTSRLKSRREFVTASPKRTQSLNRLTITPCTLSLTNLKEQSQKVRQQSSMTVNM